MRILCLILLSLLGFSAQAQVTAQLDKNPALIGETLTLSIRSESGSDEPELSVLDTDFQILGRSSSSQIQMINGDFSRSHEWVIRLRPRRAGDLVIPPIQVGQHQTSAIRLRVEKPRQQPGERPEAFIEFETSKDTAYLREEILLTARLHVRGQLLSGSFTDPTAPNAVIEQLGDQQESQRLLGAHRYRVIERRYVLYPEVSGDLTVNAPIFNGEVASGSQPRSMFFGSSGRAIYAAGEALHIEINPPDPGFNGAHWLPARELSLSESLNPEQGPYRVGEPLTRTITLQVDGQLHTQLPRLDWASPDGAQQYTEAPQDQTLAGTQGLSAVRQYSVAIIPRMAGELVLPELRLSWWDTSRQRQREAVLPARRLQIAAAPNLPGSAGPVDTPMTGSEAPDNPRQLSPSRAGTSSPWPWQVATFAALAGWIGTLLAWWWQHRQRRSPPSHVEETSAPNRSELLRTLKNADAATCHQALLDWARTVLPAGHGLQALGRFDESGTVHAALSALDAAAFGQDAAADWPRETLIRFVSQFRHAEPNTRSRAPASALPPLYPTAR